MTSSTDIPNKYQAIIEDFARVYLDSCETEEEKKSAQKVLELFLRLSLNEIKSPTAFEPIHKQELSPIDYYHFGLDFFRPLVKIETSSLRGKEELKLIQERKERKENTVLFANHQTEADPQLISVLLEKEFPLLAQEMYFVAGERVLLDPLAAPFSRGRNLICIYSKRHIDNPPERKNEKQQHNAQTMKKLKELLDVGGAVIYVAPSGGRDRPNQDGIFWPAAFDPQSIEMFRLLARHSEKATHFHLLTLQTHELLPPPEKVEKELGEKRVAKKAACHLIFSPEINFEGMGSEITNKHERRDFIAKTLHDEVVSTYKQLL